VAVTVTRKGGRILARGVTRKGAPGKVQLTAYHATSSRARYRKVATRSSAVRAGRFGAPMARYRRGSWRVVARVKGARTARTEAGLASPTPGQTAPGRSGFTESQGAFGTSVAPGPLPGGGYIKRGARGPSVRFVQVMLLSAGIELKLSGRFDAETERAVRRFQRDRLLAVDGIVGKQTQTSLRAYRQTPR